jgi:hypothetical protein
MGVKKTGTPVCRSTSVRRHKALHYKTIVLICYFNNGGTDGSSERVLNSR